MPSTDETRDAARRKREVAELFDRSAPTYDRVGPRVFSHFGRRLVELANIPMGARVLDVATGRGAVLFPAAEAAGPDGHVTGIDLSEAMIRQTTEEIAHLGLENVEARQMDAEYLQFPDASFDCVLCGFSFFFFPQPDRSLSEMRRVLRPKGRIAISTWDRLLLDEQWDWIDEIVKAHLTPEPGTMRACEAQSPPPEFNTPAGLKKMLKRTGFTEVQVVFEAKDFIYPSEQVLWPLLSSNIALASLDRIERTTGAAGLDRLKTAVFERLRSIRQTDGIHQLWPALFTLAIKP